MLEHLSTLSTAFRIVGKFLYHVTLYDYQLSLALSPMFYAGGSYNVEEAEKYAKSYPKNFLFHSGFSDGLEV